MIHKIFSLRCARAARHQSTKKVTMNLLHKFLNRTDFTDYDDFAANVKFSVPEHFNFGYGATPRERKRS